MSRRRRQTIELPAGLIDGDEAPETAALRELKEETGYVGVVTPGGASTPALPLSPGLTDETVCVVRCVVDLGAFYLTLVPVRPRRRCERGSLRTFSSGASRRPGSLAFDPDTPRRLSTPLLTPFNSTPISSLVWATTSDAPENLTPKQELEGSEFITVLRVPVKGLRKSLDAFADRGYHVFAGLHMMACGMEMAE